MELFTDLNSNFYTFLVGSIFMLAVYHFFMFMMNQKKIYLAYTLYIFCISLYFFGRIIPREYGLKIIFFDEIILVCSVAFYIYFGTLILELKKNNNKWYVILKRIYSILFFIAPILLFSNFFISKSLSQIIYTIITTIVTIISIVFLIRVYRFKTYESRLFFYGSVFYLVLSNFANFLYLFCDRELFETNYGFEPMLFSYVGTIIEAIVFSILVGYNVKKTELEKQKAVFQNEIQEAKLISVLKEQELTAIDAMIEGQEKERQRIANELHDDLGGLMATVKLHFNALEKEKNPKIYDKTNDLIEEAYQKIRSVAHTKNAGVLANQGLLKAVQQIAENISISNSIQVEVFDHELNQRLENSLELTLFRIIQELLTNIIKHSKASEVSIHLTNHDESLNIMVEDNGIGFDTKKINIENSMGLKSIDKRISNLNGQFSIESELGKGTIVIIDVPI